MEAGACCGSFSKTSKGTDVSTAVTIANQAQVIIRLCPVGQMAATEPFFEYIRLDLFPRHQRAPVALDFEHGSRADSKSLPHLLRNADFPIILNNSTHAANIANAARKSICVFRSLTLASSALAHNLNPNL